MLLEIRQQKNGTVVLRAPDDTLYMFEIGAKTEPAEALLQRLGRTILEILNDKDQPESVTMAGVVHQGPRAFDGAGLERNVRGVLESVVPGGSKLLDFLQGASYQGDKDDDEKEAG